MQTEGSNGFKIFQGKTNSPFTPFNLISQSFPPGNLLTNSLKGQTQEPSRSGKELSKTKVIQKAKEKEQGKRYDRGGNCVASNTSKLFIKILNKRLSRFPVVEHYLNFYDIYSQKQNILLIPLCLYSFLKQREASLHNRFHSGSEVAHSKHNTQPKFNTRHIYSEIITELKDHIECSLENSRTKYKDCSDSKKQFHLKNISIYNKISDIIRKVQQLAYGLEDLGEHKPLQKVEEKMMESEEALRVKNSSSRQISSDIKIEQQELHYHQFIEKQKSNSQQIRRNQGQTQKDSAPYDLSTLQSPLQSLYERKQREYQKAMDKVYSVIMNQRPLRELFQIFKLSVQQILIESVNYCYRRNINSRVKKNQKIIKDIYERLQGELFDSFGIQSNQFKPFLLRGWQFVIAFLTLQVAGDKKAQIYEEFKENIRRKTKYFSFTQTPCNNDPRQKFDSQYYAYSLRILEEHYQTQVQRKKQVDKDNLKQLKSKIKDWMIGYYNNTEIHKGSLSDPKIVERIFPQHKIDSQKLLLEQAFLHPSGNQIILTTFEQKEPQVKREEVQTDQMGRKREFFGESQQRTLERLIKEFQNLSKENYENFY